MRERVNVIYGNVPILIIAPHGQDDHNTVIIAETAAKCVGANAVINQGFERGQTVDVDKDIADCNRVDHCQEEIVYDEFLKPILKIKEQITKKFRGPNWVSGEESESKMLILHIHGAGDIVHKEANEQIDVIVGYGLGNLKDSLTCRAWKKNLFIDLWRMHSNKGDVYEGAGEGRYAGRSSNNMNQYFRKHQLDRQVESLQLEFPYSMRKTDLDAIETGKHLSLVLLNMLTYSSYKKEPQAKFI